jgi:hypothetical protein
MPSSLKFLVLLGTFFVPPTPEPRFKGEGTTRTTGSAEFSVFLPRVYTFR